jgi:hypothetical protein
MIVEVADICPECHTNWVSRCKCFRADRTCANGHTYHTCVKHGITVAGHADHTVGMEHCSCGKDKINDNYEPSIQDTW